MFLFNGVVFTFFQAKEVNEVVLGNWFRTGVGGGRPFPSWLLVIDDVGVLCHNYQVLLSVIFIQLLRRNLAIINELDIKVKLSVCATTAVAVTDLQCSKSLVSKKSETPSLVCYIYRNPSLFLEGWYGQESILTDV